jgi:hypothetical protein
MLSSGRHTFNGPNASGKRKTSAVGAQPRSWYARTPYWGAREAPGICDFGPASLLRLYKIAHSEIDGGLPWLIRRCRNVSSIASFGGELEVAQSRRVLRFMSFDPNSAAPQTTQAHAVPYKPASLISMGP